MVWQQKQCNPAVEFGSVAPPRRRRGRPRKAETPRPVSALDLQSRLGPRLAEAVAANWQGCSLRDLRAGTRCSAHIAEARQMGMYLTHTLFHLSMTRTGAVFGRDRTTVRHACQLVEDLRDRARFDQPLLMLETALSRWAEDFARTLAGDGA
ncbi:MAG: DNA replication initiation protein [Beijerinckiaceae bacterium]|jgi:hypothetical protein|nr:DNA replication initiation protein [Beijerinckiaceae bacterium]